MTTGPNLRQTPLAAAHSTPKHIVYDEPPLGRACRPHGAGQARATRSAPERFLWSRLLRRAVRVKAGRVALAIVVILGLFVPVALAAIPVWEEPITPVSDVIRPIFKQVVWVSIVIGVLVEGLLIYAVIKFRRRPSSPKDAVPVHGNTKLEVAWTIAPALVLAWLLVISFNGLRAIDTDYPEPDFIIEVTGHQWYWSFKYPDGQEVNDAIRVEQGKIVGFNITSKDVIHAFRIQELDVMVDANPGRVSYAWFQARQPGEFNAQCFQYCGLAHGSMRASVEVFPAGSQAVPYGTPATPPPAGNQTPPPSGGSNGTADEVSTVSLSEFRFKHPDATPFQFAKGKTVEFRLTNDDGAPHNLYLGTFATSASERVIIANSTTLGPGESTSFTFTMPNEDIAYDVWCNIPGHAIPGGMKTKLGVGNADLGDGGDDGPKPMLPGPGPLAVLALLGVVAAAYARRRR
jgi:cytochrome c oxidase subunit II